MAENRSEQLNPFQSFEYRPLDYNNNTSLQPQHPGHDLLLLRTESSSHYGNYFSYQPSRTSYALPSPSKTRSSVEHLADFAAAEPSQWSEPAKSFHPSQENRSTSLHDADCWDYSWATAPDAHDIDFVRDGGDISLSCLRILLAKNVAKRDGLVLIGPSYWGEWTKLSDKETPILPKCFDKSLLDTRTQMILVPPYSLPCLFAISRSALGTSPIYFYPLAGVDFQPEVMHGFFDWLLQSGSPKFQRLSSPPPEKVADAGVHLILNAMALAEFHSSGQLPRDIRTGQSRKDIVSFRERALIQLTSDSKSPRKPIKTTSQQVGRKRVGGSARLEDSQMFRFVEFENGVPRKRQKQNEEHPPRRSGPLPESSRAEAWEVRKRGGACTRCKKLKKKCDGNVPCNQCQKRDPRKTSKWLEPCTREHSHASKDRESPKVEHFARQTNNEIRDSAIEEQPEEIARVASPVMFEGNTEILKSHQIVVARESSQAWPEKSVNDPYGELKSAVAYDYWDKDDPPGAEENVERLIQLILAMEPAANLDDDVFLDALHFSVHRNNILLASLILENGGSPLLHRDDGWPPICEAVFERRISFVALFIHHGASITTSDAGHCLLHMSIDMNDVEISKLLVQHLKALNDDDLRTVGWTNLHKAIIGGSEVEVRNILKTKSASDADLVNFRDSAGWSMLKWAAWKGSLTVFKILVEAGADLDSGDYLTLAAQYGSRAMVDYMIRDKEFPVRQREVFRSTALRYAVRSKSTKQVQILVDAGLPINKIDVHGRTPLFHALQTRSTAVASLLLRRGANPLLDKGNDLLCTAAMNGLNGVMAMLLENKLPVNDWGFTLWLGIATPLIHAIKAGEFESVRVLLNHGADCNLGDARGLPIHYAAHSGSTSIFKLLLKSQEVDIEAKNNEGETARVTALDKDFFCIAKLLGYDGNVGDCKCRCCKGLEQNIDLEFSDLGSPLEMSEELYRSVSTGDIDAVRRLVRLGAPASARKIDRTKDTALHIAVRKGHKAIVSMLLDAGADYQAVNKNGTCPLHEAIHYGMPSAVAALLAAGASVNATKRRGETALMLAVEEHQIDCVQLLLQEEEINVNFIDSCGYSALSYAARHESQSILNLLLDVPGRDIDSGRISTPLQEAISYGRKGAMETLVKAGADPNKTSRFWANRLLPLVMAASKHVDFLRILLSSPRIDINAKDPKHGRTALIKASESGRKDNVSLLLQHPEIDINATDIVERTALLEALESGNNDIVALLLQQPGIDVNKVDHNGNTALMRAMIRGSFDVVQLLIQFPGIQVNTTNRDGSNALFEAISWWFTSSPDIMAVLLNHPDIDVNARRYDKTALMVATGLNRFNIVTLLLKHPNIDVNAQDSRGQTALSLARECADKRIMEALLNHPKIEPNA